MIVGSNGQCPKPTKHHKDIKARRKQPQLNSRSCPTEPAIVLRVRYIHRCLAHQVISHTLGPISQRTATSRGFVLLPPRCPSCPGFQFRIATGLPTRPCALSIGCPVRRILAVRPPPPYHPGARPRSQEASLWSPAMYVPRQIPCESYASQ